MSLWTSAEAAAATGGRVTRDFEIRGVSIDTRTIEPGDLFVALKDVRDGHDFVAKALARRGRGGDGQSCARWGARGCAAFDG